MKKRKEEWKDLREIKKERIEKSEKEKIDRKQLREERKKKEAKRERVDLNHWKRKRGQDDGILGR